MKPLAVKKEKLKKKEMAEENKKRFWKWGLFLLLALFIFGEGKAALAANCWCAQRDGMFKYTTVGDEDGYDVSNRDACKSQCSSVGGDQYSYGVSFFYQNVEGFKGDVREAGKEIYDVMKSGFGLVLKIVLYGLLQFLVWLLGVAAVIFGWVVDPNNAAFVTGNPAIYQGWAMIRDFLNLGFILVLLYIAFCVIFQIGSYSDGWKKMLLMMLIMALLVNFSFPISRFIIDVSNITFYYIYNLGFSDKDGEAIITGISSQSGLSSILDVGETSVSYLIAMVVFTFLLAITFLVIAVMFVVRMVAIGVLIIFSPIGIAGAAFPFTQKYAKEWWDSLFKYAFFAPIMMFMIMIAYSFMSFASRESFNLKAQNNLGSGVDPSFIGTMAFFSIPLVVLWTGLHVAQKLSIVGASTVTGMADKTAKWAGSLPWKGVKAGWRGTGIPGGVEQSWKKNVTQRFDRNQQKREAAVAGRLGDRTAAERNMKARAAEYEKNNESEEDLKKWAAKGDAGAAYTLANKGKMDGDTLRASMEHIKDDRARKAVLNKTSDTRMDVTLRYKYELDRAKAASDTTKKNWANIQEVAKDEYGSLTAEEWAKQKDLDKQFTFDATTNPHGNAIAAGAGESFNDLDDRAKAEALKRINGKNANAIRNIPGIVIP